MKHSRFIRFAAVIMLFVMMMPVIPESAFAASVKAKNVVITSDTNVVIDLAGTRTFRITGYVNPSNASQAVVFKSGKTSVATVSSKGVVTAKARGTTKIGVRPKNVSKWSYVNLKVIDSRIPSSIDVSASSVLLDMSETTTVYAKANPSTASQQFTWKSSNTKVVAVSNGTLVPKGVGTATVRVTSKASTSVYKNIKVTVKDKRIPSSIKLSRTTLTLEPTQTFVLAAEAFPETAGQQFTWKSNKTKVATVDANGRIQAKAAGTCLIRAYSKYSNKVYATLKLTVKYGASPSKVSVAENTMSLEIGKTGQVDPIITPANASQVLEYASNNKNVATVSSAGVVTAKKAGTATIRVRSKKATKKYADIKVTVYDASTPKSVSFAETELYLGVGDTMTIDANVEPKTSDQRVTWASSNTGVVTVSGGKLTAKAAGTATVAAKTNKGGLVAKCTVTVFSTTKSTVIPAKTTNVSGIKANLAKIKALQYSAEREVDALVKAGTITSSEGTQRKLIITRAFAMYSFPWMTLKTQAYWLAANSNGGAKNFQPGIVYYGLPYTQYNRTYDVTKALLSNHWTQTGNGYYLLNQNNLVSGRYVGNDCSGFVSLAQWGSGTSYSSLNTTAIASSNAYKKVSGYKNMRPGDLLVRSGSHTLLFLYYIDGNKDKAVVIEQGGGGVSTNTVNTSIQSMKSVTGTYTIKRKNTFG